MGSGKTELAEKLVEDVDGCLLDLDDFLNRNRDEFVNQIRYDELERAIQSCSETKLCLVAANQT